MSTKPVEGLLSKRKMNACDEADWRFRDCAVQMRTGKRRGQSHINVYHDSDGMELAIGKNFRLKSILTLQPITLVAPEYPRLPLPEEGLEVHEGTIAAVGFSTVVHQTGQYSRNGWLLSSLVIDGPLSISPLRLSEWSNRDAVANASYAIPEYKLESNELDSDNWGIFEDLTLNDFRNVAQQALSMCGVTGAGS